MFIDDFDLLAGVVVIDADLCIISAYHDPLLASYELGASYWRVCHFK